MVFDPVLIIVVFLLFNVIIITPIILYYRINTTCIRRQISRIIHLNFHNNIVDIDTGTITCSESENSNSICSDNYSDNYSDIEFGISNNDNVIYEFKYSNENENEIRHAVYL